MPAVIAMLRAVNVGGHNTIKMEELRDLCLSLGFDRARTFIQSGNVIFRSKEPSMAKLGDKLESAIAGRFGIHTDAILRAAESLAAVVDTNPFAARGEINPSQLLVTFLKADPGDEARRRFLAIKADPEELRAIGSELYIYYPLGAGKSKVSNAVIQKAIGVPGTARNMNSVARMLEVAREIES